MLQASPRPSLYAEARSNTTSGAQLAALDCALIIPHACKKLRQRTRGGQCSRTRVGRTGGKELVSTLPYWVPRARTRARMTMRRIGELMTAGAGFSSYNKVHTSFSHGVPRLPMCYVHGDRTRFCVKVAGKWRTPLAIALAVSMEPALRQHLRSTTCSAVTASLRA